MTPDSDRQLLLQLARDAVTAHVAGALQPSPELIGILAIRRGAFVTLHAREALRGCIGHIEANEPLGRVVTRCAVGACASDPRFPPVRSVELPGLTIELSLLGPLERVEHTDNIEIGRDGLVIELGRRRGLLLPQIAVEWNWDRDTFLAHTCRKAGLASDAWKNGARLWRFEAEVFSDR